MNDANHADTAASKPTSVASRGPLAGVRVIEFVGLGPGPFCAMLLADMGAEVIRIHTKNNTPSLNLLDTRFDVMARGRRSLAINLKQQGAVELMLSLIEKADGLIEGYRPGVMERLGLSPEVCLQHNPRLVYGRMTGWGQYGPLAHAAGHDVNYVALSGALHAMGNDPQLPPPIPLNLVGDFGGGGMMLAFGIVCALLETKQSGLGQVIDAAMTDGTALLTAMFRGFKEGGLWKAERYANFLDGAAHYYDNYRCADGKYVSVGAIEPKFYALLREKIGATDPAFDAQHDETQWPALKAKMEAIFLTRTRDEWCALLEGSDACFAPVLDWDEAATHPHNQARQTFIRVDDVTQPAPAPRFSRTPAPTPGSVASAGQHTEEILHDWGIDESVIAACCAASAI